MTRPPGWQATHPHPDKTGLRLEQGRVGQGPASGWTPPPMTPRQAGYLADLSRRAGVAVDTGLDVAEASERIAALIAAESHGHHHQRAPIEVPGRQRQRTATLDPYLDQQADQAVAAAERATDDLHRPSERIRTPEEIIRSERIRSPAEIRAEQEGRSTDQDQDAARTHRRDLEHGRRRERSRDPWSFGL